jgi:TonB family protein
MLMALLASAVSLAARPPLIVPPTITPLTISTVPPAPALFDRSVKPAPITPLHRLFSRQDYPAAALRSGAQGTVAVALTITAGGRVGGCAVTGSSGSEALDSATCRILASRARFTPARSGDGTAVDSAMVARVRWATPPPPLRIPLTEWRSTVRMTLGADGALITCAEENLGIGFNPGPGCRHFAAHSAQASAPLRALRPGKQPLRVLMETGLLPGADARLPAAPAKARLVSQIAAQMRIVGGTQQSCQVVSVEGLARRSPPTCKNFRGPFVVSPAPATVKTLTRLYLLPGPAE